MATNFITHRIGTSDGQDLLETAVMAKPCVWISVNDHQVALVDGYNVASMSPPVFFLASDAIPEAILKQMSTAAKGSESGTTTSPTPTRVTLSSATLREKHCLHRAKTVLSFTDMGLVPAYHHPYPPAVSSSPIHMFGHLLQLVDLEQTNGKSMVLIQIDIITMRHDVLTIPPPPSSERKIAALVDAQKLQPIASMGHGRYATMAGLHLLLRPSKKENGGWVSDSFELKPSTGDSTRTMDDDIPIDTTCTNSEERIEWITSQPSPLGFDPIKAIVIPRPIGWISTYYNSPDDAVVVPHIAPYSFYMDVARGVAPMVALSAYRPTDGPLKDVQLDIQESQCFAVSTVTPKSVIAMNLSSAPIEREESEFELAGLGAIPADYVNAPLLGGGGASSSSHGNEDDEDGSPMVLECEYAKTVDVGGFSVLIGKVVSIKVSEAVLTNGHVDGTKLKAVTRLGYNDEYAIIDQPVEIAKD